MEYLIGAGLGLATAALGHLIGFDRSRNFYPVVLIVIASYYVLFAVQASTAALWLEVVLFGAFFLVSIIGFRFSLWVVIVGLAAHGLFDMIHDTLIDNAGVPRWWPGFCLAFDVIVAVYAAARVSAVDTARPPLGG